MHALFLRYLFLTTTTSKKTKPYFLSHHHLLLLLLLVTSLFFHSIEAGRFNVDPISFDEAYKPLFGDGNVVRHPDGQGVNLLLDRYTGAGFISSDMYDHGFFSAKIKLPGDYSAGIVVAFYTSNGDVFEKTHDELDIEFLGNIQARKWRFQTNLYGNGSTSRGREERYTLWFDPTRDFHRYSILWTANRIIFFVDEVPIREIVRNEAMGGDYPSKPMQLYATIWDGSDWATGGGKYKVNYKFAPFVAEFKDLVLEGCPVDPIEKVSSEDCSDDLSTLLFAKGVATISPAQRATMKRFRERYMYYSYCYDTLRYAVAPPECVIIPSEKERFKDTGRLKFGGSHKRRRRRQRHSRVGSLSNDEAEVN